MGDYEIGYGKPPKHSQFKKGVCPNPRGRGKCGGFRPTDVVQRVLSARTEFREKGRSRKASRLELAIKRHFAAALSGDIGSAAALLRMREHAKKYGDPGPLIVNIVNSPDRQARRQTGCASRRSDWALSH